MAINVSFVTPSFLTERSGPEVSFITPSFIASSEAVPVTNRRRQVTTNNS